jgi:hypothetical protein
LKAHSGSLHWIGHSSNWRLIRPMLKPLAPTERESSRLARENLLSLRIIFHSMGQIAVWPWTRK